MSHEQVQQQVRDGGRFVMYQYCIQALWKNFSGGIDVTAEVMAQAAEPAGVPMPAPQC